MKRKLSILVATLLLAAPSLLQAQQTDEQMSFFITSVGMGDGGNLGGLQGADAHCAALARAVGVIDRQWRAYLSAGGRPDVNARDRIGNGPWYSADGRMIAANVAGLHGDIERDRNEINKSYALTEKGEQVGGPGDELSRHDILTGSDSHGRALPGSTLYTSCDNWTSNSIGSAMIGHHDRTGGGSSSWNQVHSSRSCSQEDMAPGGAGLFYCFAI